MKRSLLSMSITLTILLLSLTTFNSLSAQTRVVLPGSFQSEVSNDLCADWAPDCSSTELINTPGTNIWEGTFTIPAGCWIYKVALNGTWDENYGEGGILNGADIQLYVPEAAVVTFQYDAITHIVTSTPYSGTPQGVNKVSLYGDLQNELGCSTDWDWFCDNPALSYNPVSGKWEGAFNIPAGCYIYLIKETVGCSNFSFYGGKGVLNGNYVPLNVPASGEVSFSYDPQTHIINSTPYNGAPLRVSLYGSLQSEFGCSSDWDWFCDNPALSYNPVSAKWEGVFNIPPGCYVYQIKETVDCNNVTFYGDNGVLNGSYISLSVSVAGEISFSYDPETHIIESSPDDNTVQRVSLYGTLQSELGCSQDYDTCNNASLTYNDISGKWEAKFTLPPGCYSYFVRETVACFDNYYGEDGIQSGSQIQLSIPVESEITFSYDQQTHLMSSSPYSGAPQVLTKVTLLGDLQSELGCAYDFDYQCDNTLLNFNAGTSNWEGKFTLPAGCYQYYVKETTGCRTDSIYGENGIPSGSCIRLYVPATGEISFLYNSQTHIISSTPYTDASQTVTAVSLYGDLQSELGCGSDYDYYCNSPALSFNTASGKWEGKFILPGGCYQFTAAQTTGCDPNNRTFYGQGGTIGGAYYQLLVPAETEITFTYDPQTHLITTSPYSGVSIINVSLVGSIQSELGCSFDFDYSCDKPALIFNAVSGKWEGKFNIPAGCYAFLVKETGSCLGSNFYGENGSQSGAGIQLYVPVDEEITFSYDPQTHILTSTPYTPVPVSLTTISLYGNLQSELGCSSDYDNYCDKPAFSLNASTGIWEGKFKLPAGCYQYQIKETIGCFNTSLYGQDGIYYGSSIPLYVPVDAEIDFSYDPQTHIISSTPYSGDYQTVSNVSLYGSLQSELGTYDFDSYSNTPALTLNTASGKWEATFNLPAGCYLYQAKESIGCFSSIYYGNNNPEAFIQLYVPSQSDITFSYDPQTHIMSTTPDYVPVPMVSLYGTMQTESGCINDFDYNCDNPALTFNAVSGKWEGKFIIPQGCSQYYVKETNGCNVIFYGNNGSQFGDYNLLYTPSESEIDFSYDPQTHIITTSPYSGVPITNVSLVGDMQSSLGCFSNWDYISCNSPSLSFNQATGLWEGTFYLDAGCYKYIVKKTDGCFNTTAIGKNGSYGDQSFNYLEMYLPAATNVEIKFDPVTNLITGNFEDICLPATVVIPGTFQSELGCLPNSYNGDWEPACDATRLTYDPVSKLFIGTFNIGAGSWEYKIAYNNSWAENYGLDGIQGGANIPLELCEPSTVTFKYNYKTHLVALEFNPTAICVTKFYDANVNGINDDTIPVAGIQFKLWGKRNSVQYKYTGTDGRVSFSGLTAGNYTVSEKLPPNWVATTSEVQQVALNAPASLSFGNVCLGSGGGHNKFYWISWKGEATLNDDNTMTPELSMLSALNLRNKDGSDFDPADYKELKKWLRDAHSRNRVYGLSVQLAVLQLNVEAGFVDGNAIVYAAGCGSQGYANGFITVNELISKANLALADYGHRHGKDGKRSNLECLDNAIENANNDQGFVQPQPCTLCNTPVSSRPVIEENINEVPGKVTIWPNPSNSYFTLRPATAVSNEKIQLRVFDAAGKLVYTDNGNANKNYHFGDAFKPGLYFVEILQGNNRETFKLVKL